MHSLAFANREDLTRPFRGDQPRSGFLLAQDVSAYSLVAVARAATPLMTEGGSLTTLTYLGSTRVMPNYNVMGVAKASLEAAMRYLASDLGPQKIRVNAISAGPIKTASARAVKDFSSILDTVPRARPAAPQHRPGGSGRRRRLPGQRPGPRRHGQYAVCGCGHAGDGVLKGSDPLVQESDEALLREVTVVRQDLANALPPHDVHRNAVRQAVILVGPSFV